MMETGFNIPDSHPRAASMRIRERLIECEERSVVTKAGLFAHGRGEAFDYLIGEASMPAALSAARAAAASLLLASHPVISVNGNVAALVPEAAVELSQVSGAPLEVNLFYRTRKRELAVRDALLAAGATAVLGLGPKTATIPELFSERRIVDPDGIYKADVVVVPLEDGDRTEALKRIGKFVITIDLNPLSRTAQTADITIVDNITRAIPNIVSAIRELRPCGACAQRSVARGFDNRRNLSEALIFIRDRLTALAGGRV